MSDVVFSIGIHTDAAKAGRDQIVSWNADIVASYGRVLQAANKAGAALNISAANGSIAVAGLEKVVNALSASMEKQAQQAAAMNAALERLLKTRQGFGSVPKPPPVVDETDAQAIDRITQRMQAAKAAREADAVSAKQQKAAQDALNASIQQGAGGQISTAGLLATTAAARKATDSVETLTRARKDDEAASNALVKSADTLIGRYAPMIKAQEQLATDKAAFAKLQKEQTYTAEQEAAVLSGLEARAKTLTATQNALGGSTKAQAEHFQSLKYQLIDVVTGLISGQSPMAILAQQGGQIIQTLDGMGLSFAGASTEALVLGGVVVGVTAGLLALVAAQAAYSSSQKELSDSLRVSGNATGYTKEQLNDLAEEIAHASGITIKEARTIEGAFARAGLSGRAIGDAAELVRDYAHATGTELPQAASKFADAFRDPVAAAKSLDAQFHLLSDAQLLQIKTLSDSGQKLEAFTLITDAMRSRMKGLADEGVGYLGKTIKWLGDTASKAWDDLGSVGKADTFEERLAKMAEDADAAKKRIGKSLAELNAMSNADFGRYLAKTPGAAQAHATMSEYVQELFSYGEGLGGPAQAARAQAAQEEEKAVNDLVQSYAPATMKALDLQAAQVRLTNDIKTGTGDIRLLTAALKEVESQLRTIADPFGDFATKMEQSLSITTAKAGAMREAFAQLQQIGLRPENRGKEIGFDQAIQVQKPIDEQKIQDSKNRVKILKETEEATRALAAAQASTNPSAIAKATIDLSIAQREANGEVVTSEEKNRLLGQAMAELSGQIGAQVTQLNQQTIAQQRLADAAGLGEAAQRAATAENNIAAAVLRGMSEATARAAENDKELATRQQIHKEFAAGINLEVAANDRLVKAMQAGGTAWRDAETYTAAYAQTLREVPFPKAGESVEEWNKRLQDNIALIEKQKKSLDGKAIADYGKQPEAQSRQLKLQQSLIGATPQQAARFQTEYDINELLVKQGRSYDSLTDAERKSLDEARARSLANADLEQQIARQKDAWDTLTGNLTKAFDQVGNAIVDAFAKGETKSINWGSITKGIIANLMTDLLKMAAVNPLSNAILGTNKGTLFDLVSGGSQPAASQGGGLNGSLSRVAQVGQNLYSGVTGSTSSALAGAGTYLAESSLGHSLGLSTAYPMMTSGYAGTASQVGTIYAANPSGIALSNGLGAIGAAAPYGFLGGMGGAALSNAYMGGSKIGGALTGAALGVGSYALGSAAMGAMGMGAAASAAGASGMAGASAALSAIPVYGWVAAAAIAAVTAALGSQKPSVGPNAQGNVLYQNGHYVQGPSAADNGGDDSNVKTVTGAVAQGFNTLATNYGLTLGAKNYGYWEGGTSAATGNGVHNDSKELVRKILGDATASDPGSNVAKALANETVRASGDLEEIQKYLDVAAKIDNATEAFRELNTSLDQVQAAAKKAAADGFAKIDEEIKTADKIGLGREYRTSLDQTIRSTFEGAVQAATPWETAMANLRGETDAWIEAVTRWNVGVSEAEIRADAAAKATKLRTQAMEEYNAALYTAQGRDYLTTLKGISDNRDTARRNLAAVGVEDAAGKADALIAAQLTNALSGLDLAALADVTRTLGGEIGALAETMRVAAQATATEDLTVRQLRAEGHGEAADGLELMLKQVREMVAAIEAGYDEAYLASLRYVQSLEQQAAATQRAAQVASYTADLNSRMWTAVGNTRSGGLLALDQQQAAALAEARANGYDVTQLQQVQAAERAAQAFTLAQQDVLAAYDQQINAQQELVQSLQSGAVAAAQVARQFRQAFDQLAINDNSPLSPLAKLEEARRQFTDAAATARSATATEAEKTAAQSTLQSLGPTLIQLAQAYYASSSTEDYDRVRAVYAEFGNLQEQGLDTADQQLEAANRTLSELQQQRAEAARIGERQYGAITDLRSVMDQSYAIWQSALTPLQRLTGTTASATVAQMTTGLTAASLPSVVAWARTQGADTLQQVLVAADTQLGQGNNPYRYSAPEDVASMAGTGFTDDTALSWLRQQGYGGAYDNNANAYIVSRGLGDQFTGFLRQWKADHPATTPSTPTTPQTPVVDPESPADRRARLAAFSDAQIESAFGWVPDLAAARAANPYFDLRDWFERFGIDEVLSGARSIPGFATGTGSAPPGMAWVGEHGRELVQMAGGERVYPHAESMAIAGRWAANDRWGGVAEFRPARPRGDAGDAAEETRQLRAEVARLHRTMDRMASMLGDQGAKQIEVQEDIADSSRAAATGGRRKVLNVG